MAVSAVREIGSADPITQTAETAISKSEDNASKNDAAEARIAYLEARATLLQGSIDENQSRLSLSPFWVAGKVASGRSILSSSGRHDFSVSRQGTGRYLIQWDTAHPLGRDYVYSISQELGSNFVVHSMSENVGQSSTSMQVRFTNFQNSDRDTEFCFVILG